MSKVLFFAPYSAIWQHAFPEALAARSLANEGHEVLYVGCRGILSGHCIAMEGNQVPFTASREAKIKICRQCIENSDRIVEELNFKRVFIDDFVTAEKRAALKLEIEALSPNDSLNLEKNGIAVGKLGAYETLLSLKKQDLLFTSVEWERHKVALLNALLCQAAAEEILKSFRADVIVSYNPVYSTNAIFSETARRNGAKVYFVYLSFNLSNRLGYMLMGRKHQLSYLEIKSRSFSRVQDRPIPPHAVFRVRDHFRELLRGASPFAYSAATTRKQLDVRTFFKIGSTQRIAVAAMSSPDERLAAEMAGVFQHYDDLIFKNQIEWISELISYARRTPELFVIVRVHPREFPNKRDAAKSEHAILLEKVLVDLPENVAVNWPHQGISLYTLSNCTNAFLSAWSSVGREMAALGLPVVIYAPELLLYSSTLNSVATSQEDYFEKVKIAIETEWSLETARRGFRWYAWETEYDAIEISRFVECNENRRSLTRFAKRVFSATGLWDYKRWLLRRGAGGLKESPEISRMINEGVDLTLPRPEWDQATIEAESSALIPSLRELITAISKSVPTGESRLLNSFLDAEKNDGTSATVKFTSGS